MLKRTLVALALIGATISAHATTVVISENFDNVPGLSAAGWQFINASNPPGDTTWAQGDPGGAILNAYSGRSNSFIAANYGVGQSGGQLNDYLITPLFDTSGIVNVSFFARSAADEGYTDQIAFGFSSGTSTDLSTFTLIDPVLLSTQDWVQYTASFLGNGAGTQGRFAIVYTGPDDTANYIGVDSLTVTVPEPATIMTFGIGMLGLLALRRRNAS